MPLLVDLVGFTGSGLSHTNWAGFREKLPERLDRLIGEQRMPPVVVVFPDCFTRLGGDQYINSASMGLWEDFLLDEMLPVIEQRFGRGGPGCRACSARARAGMARSHMRCAAREAAKKHPEGYGKVINVLPMAASYDRCVSAPHENMGAAS